MAKHLAKQAIGDFLVHNCFLSSRVCILCTSLHEKSIKELHAGGFTGHLGRDKTINSIEDRYYWPQLKMDATKFINVQLSNAKGT